MGKKMGTREKTGSEQRNLKKRRKRAIREKPK